MDSDKSAQLPIALSSILELLVRLCIGNEITDAELEELARICHVQIAHTHF